MGTRRYVARAEQWGLGETETGKEQVAVGFHILTEDADIGYITWHGYFTEATLDRTIESLRICGWAGDDLSDLQGLDKNEVELVIEDDTYDGKTRPKVRWVNRVGGGLALKAPLSGDKLKSFAAAMKSQIRAADATSGQRKPPSAKPKTSTPPSAQGRPGFEFGDEPPPLSDSDIPF